MSKLDQSITIGLALASFTLPNLAEAASLTRVASHSVQIVGHSSVSRDREFRDDVYISERSLDVIKSKYEELVKSGIELNGDLDPINFRESLAKYEERLQRVSGTSNPDMEMEAEAGKLRADLSNQLDNMLMFLDFPEISERLEASFRRYTREHADKVENIASARRAIDSANSAYHAGRLDEVRSEADQAKRDLRSFDTRLGYLLGGVTIIALAGRAVALIRKERE